MSIREDCMSRKLCWHGKRIWSTLELHFLWQEKFRNGHECAGCNAVEHICQESKLKSQKEELSMINWQRAKGNLIVRFFLPLSHLHALEHLSQGFRGYNTTVQLVGLDEHDGYPTLNTRWDSTLKRCSCYSEIKPECPLSAPAVTFFYLMEIYFVQIFNTTL